MNDANKYNNINANPNDRKYIFKLLYAFKFKLTDIEFTFS